MNYGAMPSGRQRHTVHKSRNGSLLPDQKRPQWRIACDPTGVLATSLPECKWRGRVLLERHVQNGPYHTVGPTARFRILGGCSSIRCLDPQSDGTHETEIGGAGTVIHVHTKAVLGHGQGTSSNMLQLRGETSSRRRENPCSTTKTNGVRRVCCRLWLLSSVECMIRKERPICPSIGDMQMSIL